jgi:hypothetical protein
MTQPMAKRPEEWVKAKEAISLETASFYFYRRLVRKI